MIDPDASYSAWLHEYKHARDDQEAGWLGMGQLFDSDLRWEREQAAYQCEIDYMESNGHHEVADDLKQLREFERQRIYGDLNE